MKTNIAILGGGIAGLGAAYYARKNKLDFLLFESSDAIGGNCKTFTYDAFKLDSGAHRFHDKDQEITKEIKQLMGQVLQEINLPSMIYDNQRFIRFPLQPFELLKHLGILQFARAGFEVIQNRFISHQEIKNFKQFAMENYGRLIAEKFLLNYSKKLWGRSCDQLSPDIGGKRLNGLSLKMFLTQSFLKRKNIENHMEGRFYYPEDGILAISEKLADMSGRENIQCGNRVTGLLHNGKTIHSIEINGTKKIACQTVVNSLPLDMTLKLLRPQVPLDILSQTEKLTYRHLRLAAFFINRPSIMNAATLYFPDQRFPFTRIYEPKNRSAKMSPRLKTSLVAEVPCFEEDKLWKSKSEDFLAEIEGAILKTGLVKQSEVIHKEAYPLEGAYPVLDLPAVEHAEKSRDYLGKFSNMSQLGRNATYRYIWMHNILKQGKEIIAKIAASQSEKI